MNVVQLYTARGREIGRLLVEGGIGVRRRSAPTARAHLLLRVRCKDCRHQVDLDPAEQAERHGADLAVPEWATRLGCSKCGSRRIDFVVTPDSTGGLWP